MKYFAMENQLVTTLFAPVLVHVSDQTTVHVSVILHLELNVMRQIVAMYLIVILMQVTEYVLV